MANIQNIDVEALLKSIPDSLKPQGSAKLGNIIYDKGKVIQQLLTPIATKLLTDAISPDDICVPQTTLDKLIFERNALVGQLNNIGTSLDTITKSITGLNTFFNLVVTISNTISIAKTVISAAAKLTPLIPGAVPAALSDLEDAKNKLIFTNTGTSKLDKIQSSITTSAISISLVNGFILTIVNVLNSLDTILIKCSPNSTFIPISKGINDSADVQRQAEVTLNQTTYQGFIIEIQEVPYTPTVIRRRALGKNQQGIILIQTELSFTTNPLTLINELKSIIDKDNLKAY
jgi:hypothetical protein